MSKKEFVVVITVEIFLKKKLGVLSFLDRFVILSENRPGGVAEQ
jgi:hypothetical protein